MIISILGTSGEHKGKNYKFILYCRKCIKKDFIQDGEYINSTDALLKNFPNKKFVFIGTNDAINMQKRILQLKNSYEFHSYHKDNINELFQKIFNIVNSAKEDIIFDITHGFRDSSIMAVLSTIINQFVQDNKIRIVFAREVEQHKIYEYIQIDEYIDVSKMSFILTTFKQTLKVPELDNFNSSLYLSLKSFSENLVSNQFHKLFNKDYNKLVEEIKKAQKENYSFLYELLESILQEINFIKKIKDEPEHIKFYYFAELFFKKKYYLHTVSYLVEGIPLYVFNYQKRNNIIISTTEYSYKVSQKINNNLNYGSYRKLYNLRDKIKEIRNNLAHINVHYEVEAPELKLQTLLHEYESLVLKDYLTNEVKQQKIQKSNKPTKYQSDLLYKQLKKKFNIQLGRTVNPKKILEAYFDNTIMDKYQLSDNQIKKLGSFIEENKDLINELIDIPMFINKEKYLRIKTLIKSIKK